MTTWQGQAPPGFARRWLVQATTPNAHPCTTTYDLTTNHQYLMVRPTPDDRFSTLIDATGIQILLHTINTNAACAIPGRHIDQGMWLLGLRPNEPNWTTRPTNTPPRPGPLELYVHLPTAEINVIYPLRHLQTLHDTLTEILQFMTPSPSPHPIL